MVYGNESMKTELLYLYQGFDPATDKLPENKFDLDIRMGAINQRDADILFLWKRVHSPCSNLNSKYLCIKNVHKTPPFTFLFSGAAVWKIKSWDREERNSQGADTDHAAQSSLRPKHWTDWDASTWTRKRSFSSQCQKTTWFARCWWLGMLKINGTQTPHFPFFFGCFSFRDTYMGSKSKGS